MTQTDPPTTSPWYMQILTNTSIQGWIERIIVAAIMAFLAFRAQGTHEKVNTAVDTQQKQIAVEVRGTPQDVQALAATTQK